MSPPGKGNSPAGEKIEAAIKLGMFCEFFSKIPVMEFIS